MGHSKQTSKKAATAAAKAVQGKGGKKAAATAGGSALAQKHGKKSRD